MAQVYFKSDRGVGWGTAPDKPMFSVMKPFDGQAASVGNGVMVALAAFCMTKGREERCPCRVSMSTRLRSTP